MLRGINYIFQTFLKTQKQSMKSTKDWGCRKLTTPHCVSQCHLVPPLHDISSDFSYSQEYAPTLWKQGGQIKTADLTLRDIYPFVVLGSWLLFSLCWQRSLTAEKGSESGVLPRCVGMCFSHLPLRSVQPQEGQV